MAGHHSSLTPQNVLRLVLSDSSEDEMFDGSDEDFGLIEEIVGYSSSSNGQSDFEDEESGQIAEYEGDEMSSGMQHDTENLMDEEMSSVQDTEAMEETTSDDEIMTNSRTDAESNDAYVADDEESEYESEDEDGNTETTVRGKSNDFEYVEYNVILELKLTLIFFEGLHGKVV